MQINEVIQKFSIEELKQEWRRTKPQTLDGMLAFLKQLGFTSSQTQDIIKKSNISPEAATAFDTSSKIKNIVDVAIEANLVPHVLKYLQNAPTTESMVFESVEHLTNDEVRAILTTLFDMAARYEQNPRLEKFESIRHLSPKTHSQLVLLEMREIVNKRTTIDLEEYKNLSIALIEADLSWKDLNLVGVVKSTSVLLVQEGLVKHRAVIEDLIYLGK